MWQKSKAAAQQVFKPKDQAQKVLKIPTPSLLWTREFLHRIVEEAARFICLPTRNGSHSAAPWAFIRRYKDQDDTPAGCNHLIYISCSCLLRSEPWETLTDVPKWRDCSITTKNGTFDTYKEWLQHPAILTVWNSEGWSSQGQQENSVAAWSHDQAQVAEWLMKWWIYPAKRRE